MIQAVAERVALSVENARLFDETSRRAARERLVTEITSKIRSLNDPAGHDGHRSGGTEERPGRFACADRAAGRRRRQPGPDRGHSRPAIASSG